MINENKDLIKIKNYNKNTKTGNIKTIYYIKQINCDFLFCIKELESNWELESSKYIKQKYQTKKRTY